MRALWAVLILVACNAQAGETFYREAGANSVVIGPICVPELAGEEFYGSLDFGTANLVITIAASAQAPGTTWNYTGGNLDDGPNSATWGAPAASAIEIDLLSVGALAGCINLHLRDEVLDVAGAVEWSIIISDGGVLIMDHTVQILAIESAATMAGIIHTNLETGNPIKASMDAVSGDTTAADTLEAWIDAAVLPANVLQYNGTNATSAAGRPEVNVSHFGGTAGTFASGIPTAGVADGHLVAAKFGADAFTAAKFAADVGTEFGTAAWATTTRTLTALDEDTTTLDLNATTIGTVTTYTGNTPQTGDTFAALEMHAILDSSFLNCTVNTAFFAGSATTLACILTDKNAGAVTVASGDLTGLQVVITSGTQLYEGRFINSTVWDGANSELRVTLSRALPATLADGVTAVIR